MARPLSPHDGGRGSEGTRPGEVRAHPNGFTLLELLAVVAIIAVLAALVLGATAGAGERTRRARAGAELAVLAQALEAYRAQFGDYPRTGAAPNLPAGPAAADDGPGILFNALTGRRGPSAVLQPIEARVLVPLASCVLASDALPTAGSTAQRANAFVDPWAQRYLYWYKTGASWSAPTPVLLSAGPDGLVELPAESADWDGTPPAGAGANADNLAAFGPSS